MKRILLFVILSMVVMLSAKVFAQEGSYEDVLGVIDTQLVMQKYKQTEKVNSFLSNEKAKMEKELDAKQSKLKERSALFAKKTDEDKKTEKPEIDKMVKEFEDTQKKYESNLKEIYNKEMLKIKDSIYKTIADVSKKKRLKHTFEKSILYYGGVDITEEVISQLNANLETKQNIDKIKK